MEFPIASSPTSTVVFAGVIALITLIIGLAFTWFAFTASSLTTSIEDASLNIRIPIYGRSIPLSHLNTPSAQIVDLDRSSQLRPRIRTNGIGMPGYSVGWFKLYNGEKALSAITSRKSVLYIQTTEGYSLLLSLEDPKGFLGQLNDVSNSGVN